MILYEETSKVSTQISWENNNASGHNISNTETQQEWLQVKEANSLQGPAENKVPTKYFELRKNKYSVKNINHQWNKLQDKWYLVSLDWTSKILSKCRYIPKKS